MTGKTWPKHTQPIHLWAIAHFGSQHNYTLTKPVLPFKVRHKTRRGKTLTINPTHSIRPLSHNCVCNFASNPRTSDRKVSLLKLLPPNRDACRPPSTHYTRRRRTYSAIVASRSSASPQ
jgi:hypothetical protein